MPYRPQRRFKLNAAAQAMAVSAALLILCGQSDVALAAEVDWSPQQTWVFVAGLLEWEHPDFWPPFPAAKKNRRDEQLVQYFRRAGVPENHLTYLQDTQATKKQIRQKFVELLDQTRANDLLIFYFCGHGYRNLKTNQTWFANYDAGRKDSSAWNVSEIFGTIDEHFHGDRVLLLADCCHSGALYDLAQQHRDSKIAYAVLTSSYSHNSSTGHWTFTDCVLAGLRGQAGIDLNGDHVINFYELSTYCETEMAFVEGQKSMSLTSDRFPNRTKLAEVHATSKPRVGLRIEVSKQGEWQRAKTIDSRGDQLQVAFVNERRTSDEWVTTDRIRPYQPAQFAVGDKLDVEWPDDAKWYRATVLRGWYGLHLVHYDGYSSTWDEWVGPDRIRLPAASTPQRDSKDEE